MWSSPTWRESDRQRETGWEIFYEWKTETISWPSVNIILCRTHSHTTLNRFCELNKDHCIGKLGGQHGHVCSCEIRAVSGDIKVGDLPQGMGLYFWVNWVCCSHTLALHACYCTPPHLCVHNDAPYKAQGCNSTCAATLPPLPPKGLCAHE